MQIFRIEKGDIFPKSQSPPLLAGGAEMVEVTGWVLCFAAQYPFRRSLLAPSVDGNGQRRCGVELLCGAVYLQTCVAGAIYAWQVEHATASCDIQAAQCGMADMRNIIRGPGK